MKDDAYPYGSHAILTIRREVESAADDQASRDRTARALDIATLRLAWCLQQFPEVAAAYDAAWRKA